MSDPAMHGKSGYERIERDAYYTPAWCTEALLRHVEFEGPIWECAAGALDMAKVLTDAGYDVAASDIAYGWKEYEAGLYCLDFLTTELPVGTLHIVTNPPYALAREFIERALELTAKPLGKVAMLLRNEYDSAKTRQHLFSQCPQFALKLVLTKRPKWFADEKASPRHNFSWFVWDWAHEGPPILRYDQ